MYSITLVCTRHENLGRCNSNELYQIIASIKPEVIFEEIPPSYFDHYYKHKSKGNLESDTINLYLRNHLVKHIPIDSEKVPSETFCKEYEYLLKRIEGLADINGFNYRNYIDTFRTQVETHGFTYLNSIYCDNLNIELHDAIEKGLQKLNDTKLFQTSQLWKEINENRENEMLKNIYDYSKGHCFENAIFLIGAAHRKSIMKKIEECNKNEKVKLNWLFYNC